MNIKTIVFDYGGVVFSKGTTDALEKFISKKFNIPRESVHKFIRGSAKKEGYLFRKGKITSREYWKAFRRELNLSERETDEIKKFWIDSYKPNKGMKDILKKLHKNYKLIVFSGNVRERILALNKRYKMNKFFDAFIFSYIYKQHKRDAAIYKILRRKIKNPDETIIIDDYNYVLENVRKVGFKNVILFKNANQLKLELRKFGVKI